MAGEDLNNWKIGDGESSIKNEITVTRQQLKDFPECVLVEHQSALYAHYCLPGQHKVGKRIINKIRS